jgi:nitroreductase
MRASGKAEAAVNILDAVIRSRKAIRAFRSDPVPKRLLMEVVEAARAAPSNYNSQPWRVYLLTGRAKDALGEAITRAYHTNTTPPFSPFPQPTPTDCAARVDEFGRRYYSALGIDRSDMTARARQTGRNYVFFGAPVGLIFTTHAALTRHSCLDCGLSAEMTYSQNHSPSNFRAMCARVMYEAAVEAIGKDVVRSRPSISPQRRHRRAIWKNAAANHRPAARTPEE